MSKYKYLVLTDLDGTLLNSSGRLSAFTIDYVHKLNKRDDILFSFSTGRCWKDAEHIYKDLKLKGFVSCCNGAFIYDPHQGIHVYSYLSEAIWEGILSDDAFFKNLKAGDILTDKGTIEFDANSNRLELIKKIKSSKSNVYAVKVFFNQLGINEDSEDVDRRLRFLKSFELSPYLTIYHYSHHKTIDFEIQAPAVNKEKAVDFLSNYYGIQKRNILTFGDQINDLPVAWGTSFFTAVKNAIGLLKYRACQVSEFTNDEDSVVKEIDLFLAKPCHS